MKFYAFYVPQDKNILSTNFKAFSYHLKNEFDIIEEFGQKLSILKGTIPHEPNPIKSIWGMKVKNLGMVWVGRRMIGVSAQTIPPSTMRVWPVI